MKKYFLLLAAAAAIFAVSCQREQTQESENPTQTVIDDSVPMPILFGAHAPQVKAPETKGVGGIDAWRADLQQPLYIYGMERNAQGEHLAYNWGDNANPEVTPFINNIAAVAPDPNGQPAENGDGYRDPINVYNPHATVGNEPFYYVEGKVYDFYGYYVDDAMGVDANNNNAVIEPAPKINDGSNLSAGDVISTIVLEDLTLDGSQDIMVAQTDKDEDWALRSEYVSIDMIYSARSARRNVKPDLVFKHELARFEFHIFNGSSNYITSTQQTEASIANADITVTGLELASFNKAATGDLTIYPETAANYGFNADDLQTPVDPDNNPDYTLLDYFPLRVATNDLTTGDPIGDPTQDPVVGVNPVSLTDGKAVVEPANQRGESIMIVAGEEKYDIKVLINQTGVTAPGFNPAEQHLTIDMSQVKDVNGDLIGATVSEKGKKYVVSLIIYGLEQIEVTVTLTDWEDGGTIEIDPDQDPADWREEAKITIDGSCPNPIPVKVNGTFEVAQYISSDNKYSDIEYTSSDPTKFTVDAKGVITGVAEGDAELILNQAQSVSHLAADEVRIPVTVTADDRATLDITTPYENDLVSMPLYDSKGYYSTRRFREEVKQAGAAPQHAIGEKTFTVESGDAYVTVDPKTGVITAKAETPAGTPAVVRLTIAANEFYQEATFDLNVEVTVARQASSFDDIDPIAINWADRSNTDGGVIAVANEVGDGAVTFAVTAGTSVTVDENTGAITIVDLGETTITVTKAQTANYESVSKTVTVTVNEGRAANTITAVDQALIDGAQIAANVTSGGVIVFTSGDTNVATIAGDVITWDVNAQDGDTVQVTISSAATDTYLAADDVVITVTKTS